MTILRRPGAKASPESTARAILAGVEKEDEEIFPDPMSEAIAEGWRISAVKALQRQFAAYVEQTPVKRWLIHLLIIACIWAG